MDRERSIRRQLCTRSRWQDNEHPGEIRRKGAGGFWTARPVDEPDDEPERVPVALVDIWHGWPFTTTRRETMLKTGVFDVVANHNQLRQAFVAGYMSAPKVQRHAEGRTHRRRRSDPLTGPLRRHEGTISRDEYCLRCLPKNERDTIITAERIASRLAASGSDSWSNLRRCASSSNRHLLEPAIHRLIERGVVREVPSNRGRRFEITQGSVAERVAHR